MKRRGSSGAITLLILLLILLIIGGFIYNLIQTDYFDTEGNYVVTEASKASIAQFKNECKYYGYINVVENQEKLKDKPIRYTGTIEEIKSNTFIGYRVRVKVKIPDEELDKIDKESTPHSSTGSTYYKYIIVKMSEEKYIQAVEGNKANVYGYLDSIDRKDSNCMIRVKGTRITALDD